MRIAQVAPLVERVPPHQYGGTERVVAYLTDELVARGHAVTLFASGDSITRARLVAGCERSLRLHASSVDPVAAHLDMLLRVYDRARDFDVIHCHTDYLGLPLSRTVAVPTVLTLHGRLDLAEVHPIYRSFPNVMFVSISTAQREPLTGVRWAATVHHGIPRNLYPFDDRPQRRHLLFLGRMSPEKAPDVAIRVAVRAGVPLKIAAKVDPSDRRYFETVVEPMLDHPLVEFIGEVDDGRKGRLLSEALALLFPVDWPEPFGMVVIESLACGTPVIASRRGSVPELLTHGKTGFVCDGEDDMVTAVERISSLERQACRDEFERRFSVEAMTDAYLRVYERARKTAGDGIRLVPTAQVAPSLPV